MHNTWRHGIAAAAAAAILPGKYCVLLRTPVNSSSSNNNNNDDIIRTVHPGTGSTNPTGARIASFPPTTTTTTTTELGLQRMWHYVTRENAPRKCATKNGVKANEWGAGKGWVGEVRGRQKGCSDDAPAEWSWIYFVACTTATSCPSTSDLHPFKCTRYYYSAFSNKTYTRTNNIRVSRKNN